MFKIIKIGLLLSSAMLLTGCDKLSMFTCLLFNSQKECIEKEILNVEGSKKLKRGDKIAGDSDIFLISIPSDNWIKLPTAKNKQFPNRDMRLVYSQGYSFIDIDTTSQSLLTAKDISAKSVIDFTNEDGVQFVEIPFESGDQRIKDSYFSEGCFKKKNSDLKVCIYSLVVKTQLNTISFLGMAPLLEGVQSDLVSIFRSIQLKNEESLPN